MLLLSLNERKLFYYFFKNLNINELCFALAFRNNTHPFSITWLINCINYEKLPILCVQTIL